MEGEREEPHRHLSVDHRFVILGTAIQCQIGQSHCTMSQRFHIILSAFEENGIQAAQTDHIRTRALAMLEQMLQNPGADARMICLQTFRAHASSVHHFFQSMIDHMRPILRRQALLEQPGRWELQFIVLFDAILYQQRQSTVIPQRLLEDSVIYSRVLGFK